MTHLNRSLLRYLNLRLHWRLLGKQGRKLVTRVASASIMLPIGLYCVWQGGVILQVVTGVLAMTAALEWGSMVEKNKRPAAWGGGVIALAALIAIVMVGSWPQYMWILVVTTMLLGMALARDSRAEMAFAGVYIVCPAPAFYILREQAMNGQILALALLMTVIAVDVAAYFGGKSFGGARLMPRISPAKTWAGAISGFIGAALIGLGFALWSHGNVLHWVIWTLIIGLVAQAGDLLESLFKRRFGVKDTSNLVPGHGGVLDRIDSSIAISLFAWMVFMLKPELIPQPGAF